MTLAWKSLWYALSGLECLFFNLIITGQKSVHFKLNGKMGKRLYKIHFGVNYHQHH